MNSQAILNLISELYASLEALQGENQNLKKEAVDPDATADPLGGPEEADRQAREEAKA